MDEEQLARKAIENMYQAIESVVSGAGLGAMADAWHHTDWVTTKHPISGWAIGWEQVWTTWRVVEPFGRADRAGSSVRDLHVVVRGEMAFGGCTFHASEAWGSGQIPCTNVVCKLDGQWKIVHHHADDNAAMVTCLERMLTTG